VTSVIGDDFFVLSRQRRDSRPLSHLLPYVMCGRALDLEPLHLLDDGALGFALEFDAPVVDTEITAEDTISGLIDQSLRALPAGVYWQWFIRSNTFVEQELETYMSQPGIDPVAKACASQYVQRWRTAQREGFFPKDASVNFFPRSQSILLSLKSPPFPPKQLSFTTIFSRASQAETTAKRFVDAARNLLAVLATHGIQAKPVGSDRLANWVADLLFPWRRFARPPIFTNLHSVREAVAAAGHIESVALRGFCTVSDGTEAHHRIVSMLWHPRAVRPGMLNDLILLRPTLCVSLCSRVLPLATSTLQLKAQSFFNARASNRFNLVETQARADALGDVEQRLFSEGERLIDGRLQVHVIEATPEEAEDAARVVCAHLRELDIEAALEEDIGSSLILRGCLPFTVNEATERKLRRGRRFLSRDFADMHPAGGSWKGFSRSDQDMNLETPKAAPIVMYSNPVGEALFLDPSKAERNPHALVVGQSGSGKSFFVHDYLLHLWRLPDVRLFLVSIKPDYRKLALLLGRYVELSLDSAESLNPFAGAPTLENQARWVAALSLMITEGRPNHQLPRELEILLQDAALAASARNWDSERLRPIRETVLEDICLELERRAGTVGRNLSFQLLPYRRGPFRRLFNGQRTLRFEERFVFFNLGNILQQPCSAAASFCVFNLIDQVMHEPSLRAIPKGLIADEVWALVQDPFAAAILERSLKAYRSLGGFAVPIVQDPRDLDTPAGRAILVNTASKVILPMDRSGQNEISRFVRLNDRELELVRNLRLVKRRYSEFFVSVEGIHSAKGLVIPDPLRYAISTTDPVDEAELERLFQETGDMLQAVQQFAQTTPYGIRGHDGSSRTSLGRASWVLLLSLLLLSAAVVLLCVSAGFRFGPKTATPPATSEVRVKDRQKAAEEAARLLSGAQGIVDADPTSLATPLTQMIESGNVGPQPATINELREFARTLSRDVESTREASKGKTVSGTPSHLASIALPNKATNSRAQIPDQIEDALTAKDGDSLSQMPLDAHLLTFSPVLFPGELLDVRVDQTPPQARLRRRTGTESVDGAWFEPGDSPTPDWMLVNVQTNAATLMSSRGDLVQLSVVNSPSRIGDQTLPEP